MVPFAGWDMPVQYSSILDEARAVRSNAGLFDVSHMGRFELQGADAAALLNRIFSSDVQKLQVGRVRYGLICNKDGGIIDDAILYRFGEERFLLVPNAGNSDSVADWINCWSKASDRVSLEILTSRLAMIALQGPSSSTILSRLTSYPLNSLKPFRAIETLVSESHAIIARTGYSGEDGFELMVPALDSPMVWQRLAEMGAMPCGLGSRDVLRLEAGLPLHGNDIDADTNPYEAGLGKFVEPDREDYVAREALVDIHRGESRRKLVGFNMVGRGIARQDQVIMSGETRVGIVTSGTISPTLDRAIGMGYVRSGLSGSGTQLYIDSRGRLVEAEVTKLPFYSRRKSE